MPLAVIADFIKKIFWIDNQTNKKNLLSHFSAMESKTIYGMRSSSTTVERQKEYFFENELSDGDIFDPMIVVLWVIVQLRIQANLLVMKFLVKLRLRGIQNCSQVGNR